MKLPVLLFFPLLMAMSFFHVSLVLSMDPSAQSQQRSLTAGFSTYKHLYKLVLQKNVYSLVWNAQGTALLIGSGDGIIRFFSLLTGNGLQEIATPFSVINSVALSPDEKTVLAASYRSKTARLFDRDTGKIVAEFSLEQGTEVTSVAWSPCLEVVLIGASDGVIHVWSVETGNLLKQLKGHSLSISSLALSSDGERIVSGSADGTAMVWSSQTGKLICVLRGHTDSITAVSFHPHNYTVVTGSFDKTARLWDSCTGEEQLQLKDPSVGVVYDVSFAPDGNRVLTGVGGEGGTCIWDAQTGQLLCEVTGQTAHVYAVAMSSDGTFIATGSESGTILILERVV